MTGLCRPVECTFSGAVNLGAGLALAWHVSGPHLARARSRLGKGRDERERRRGEERGTQMSFSNVQGRSELRRVKEQTVLNRIRGVFYFEQSNQDPQRARSRTFAV